MNQYRDLVAKLEAIQNRVDNNTVEVSEEQAQSMSSPKDQLLVGEENVEECGLPGMSNMPSGMMGTPKQQDNVTMNVSMNGSGAGGIRDLMGILKNIENGGEEPSHSHDDNEIVVGMGEEQVTGGFDSVTTSPDAETQPVSAVLKKGPDIHGNMGDHRPRQAGLPRAQMENLVSHLNTLYQEVKGR
jgi:hypothetical protein